jgi:hypothetical protein
MGLSLVTALALCLWIVLWAIGVGGFDAFMLTTVIVLVAGALKSLAHFLPGVDRSKGPSGGW